MESARISSTFIWRRLHSLMGLWLVLYLILHLTTNSQAALWLGDGHGFVRMVNSLESLPYLHVIEVVLIGVPFAIHIVWGVQRAMTAKSNVHPTNGSKPSLRYGRNLAYSWQRLTSWILLIGVIGHVVQMRFLEMPKTATMNFKEYSVVKVSFDPQLYTLAERLGAVLYNSAEVRQMQAGKEKHIAIQLGNSYDDPAQRAKEEQKWVHLFASYSLRSNQLVAVADSPGKAMLLMVRDTFKSPWMVAFYSIFVLAAAFHAFNGFWTFLITWGAILSYRSQKSMVPVSLICACVLAFLGLAAIWGSY